MSGSQWSRLSVSWSLLLTTSSASPFILSGDDRVGREG